MSQQPRLAAVSVLGRYTDKKGEHVVHWLEFVQAKGRNEADRKARDAFLEKHPHCEVLSVLIEGVPA